MLRHSTFCNVSFYRKCCDPKCETSSRVLPKISTAGIYEGNNDLGVCYARGIGVPKDGKEALAHFGAASEGDHGFYVADSNVAYCYQNGIGVEKDKHRADVLYIVAEAKEDASRMSKAIKQMSRDVFAGKQTKTTMDEILKMNKSFERSKEKASNRKRLRMALEMDF